MLAGFPGGIASQPASQPASLRCVLARTYRAIELAALVCPSPSPGPDLSVKRISLFGEEEEEDELSICIQYYMHVRVHGLAGRGKGKRAPMLLLPGWDAHVLPCFALSCLV